MDIEVKWENNEGKFNSQGNKMKMVKLMIKSHLFDETSLIM